MGGHEVNTERDRLFLTEAESEVPKPKNKSKKKPKKQVFTVVEDKPVEVHEAPTPKKQVFTVVDDKPVEVPDAPTPKKPVFTVVDDNQGPKEAVPSKSSEPSSKVSDAPRTSPSKFVCKDRRDKKGKSDSSQEKSAMGLDGLKLMNKKFIKACKGKDDPEDSHCREMGLDDIFDRSMGIKSKTSEKDSSKKSNNSSGKDRKYSVVKDKQGTFIEIGSDPEPAQKASVPDPAKKALEPVGEEKPKEEVCAKEDSKESTKVGVHEDMNDKFIKACYSGRGRR